MSRADFPETAKTNFDEFKGKDCVFVAKWLKTKGLHKLCFAFEGVKDDLYLIIFETMARGM